MLWLPSWQPYSYIGADVARSVLIAFHGCVKVAGSITFTS